MQEWPRWKNRLIIGEFMRLRVLGCSGGIGAGLRTTSLLLDDDILIDAGTGLGDLTLDEMAAVRHVLVTHSHLDHIAGLPLLLDSIFDRIAEPIAVHAQPATIEALREHVFNWVTWPDFTQLPSPERAVVRYLPMQPGDELAFGTRRIRMIPVNHAVPGVAYRVVEGARAFAFSGDTTTNDSLWDTLNAEETLDLLIVEAAFPDRDHELARAAKHYTPRMLAADLAKLRHQPAIYLTHAKPGAEKQILEECRVAAPERNIEALTHGHTFQL